MVFEKSSGYFGGRGRPWLYFLILFNLNKAPHSFKFAMTLNAVSTFA